MEDERSYLCKSIHQNCWEAEPEKTHPSVPHSAEVSIEMPAVYLPAEGHIFRKLAYLLKEESEGHNFQGHEARKWLDKIDNLLSF